MPLWPGGGGKKSTLTFVVRKRLPDPFGDERRDRVQQAQQCVEPINQRPPDGGALLRRACLVGKGDLGEFDRLVAVLGPDRVIDALRRLRESVSGQVAVNIFNRRADARREPCAELTRRRLRTRRVGTLTRHLRGTRTEHIARRVP